MEEVSNGDDISVPSISKGVIEVDGETVVQVQTDHLTSGVSRGHDFTAAVCDVPGDFTCVAPASGSDNSRFAGLRKALDWGRDEAEGQGGRENLQLFHDGLFGHIMSANFPRKSVHTLYISR